MLPGKVSHALAPAEGRIIDSLFACPSHLFVLHAAAYMHGGPSTRSASGS